MVSLSDGQKASLSPEAVTFLSNVHHPPFASMLAPFITSPKRVPGIRQDAEAKMAPGEAALIEKHGLRVREITVAGVPVVLIDPPAAAIHPVNKNRILFNVYGGAFIMGSPRDRAALTMAGELGVRVISVRHTRSPEARYPTARDECLAVYRALTTADGPGSPEGENLDGLTLAVDPANIYAMGCSSGAQLLVTMLLVAQKEGLPLPRAGLYLCSPAVDLTGAGDTVTSNAVDRDIMPVCLLASMVSQNFLPQDGGAVDLHDPLLSPMYADAYDAHWPRTVMTAGTRDFALSDAVRFYWKLRAAGAQAELLVCDGMWHGFNWDPTVPEAIQTRAAVVAFLEEK